MSTRFNNYDPDVKQLVLSFEQGRSSGHIPFFDVDEFCIIIDFYLDGISQSRSGSFFPHNSSFDCLEYAVNAARKLYPSNDAIRLRYSHLFCVMGRYDKALPILTALEQADPSNTDVQYALGTLFSATDQPRRAIQCYLNASRDGYQLGTIFANIGDEYSNLGRIEDAIRFYKKALAQQPDDEHSLLNLESSYADMGFTADALIFFRQFVARHPYNKFAWFCLGRSYMNLYDYQAFHTAPADASALPSHASSDILSCPSPLSEAVDAFQYVLTIDKTYFDAYVLMSQCQQMMGLFSQAVATLRESIDFATDASNVLFTIASIYRSQGNLQTAVIYLRKTTDQDPFYSEAWLSLADCYLLLGDASMAEDLYQRALGMNKSNDEFWIKYADFLISFNRFDDALELLQHGIVNADYPFDFNIRLALCFFKTSRRNNMVNTLLACVSDGASLDPLFDLCPELALDPDVQSIIPAQS